MQMEDIKHMPAQEVCRVAELARKLRICDEQERKLKKLFGEFATKQEFFANIELPPRFR
jgi:hypothetical protein